MRDYFRKTTWTLDDVSFSYLQGRYRGRGLLTWRPKRGFRLEAFVTRSGPPLPEKFQFWQLRLATKQDRTSIRMKIQYKGRAYVLANLVDRFDVVTQGRLSCRFGAMHFMLPLPAVAKSAKRWQGSALIKVGKGRVWPDKVVRTTELEAETFGKSYAQEGLAHETPTLRVAGRVDGGHLEVHWSMDKAAYRRGDAWRWPRAFRDALSIELGASLPLLERETLVFSSQHVERLKPAKIVRLDPFQPFEDDLIQKARLFALTEFLMKDSREARVCRKLFDQMVRARQQRRWDDIELILSTALEGALRAIEGVPSTDKGWDLGASLSRFRQRHLSSAWRPACKHALTAFEHLRHSNAHPDWILDKADLAAEAERSRSFSELRFLSRFYGYMILALAGVPDLQPIFGGRSMAPPTDTPKPDAAGADAALM